MNRYLNIKQLVAIGLCALTGLGFASSASAEPKLDGTFTPSGQPGQMTLGPDGNVWFTLVTSSEGNEFGKIAPDGTITEYETPNGKAVTGITSGPDEIGGPNNRIWMSQEKSVVKWNPETGNGAALVQPYLDGPRGITADESGYVWAVDDFGSLLRISPIGVPFEFGVNGSGGRGIAFSGGDLWWADFGQQAIQRSPRATANNPVTYDVGGGPQEVTAGPQGQIAYTNPGDFPQTVGLIAANGQVNETEVPGTDPFGITYAEDKAYWVANFASDDLTRLTTSGAVSKPVELPVGSGPRYLARGQGGTLWVALESFGRIARITGVEDSGGNNGGNGGNGGNNGGNNGGGNGNSGKTKLGLSGVKLLKGKKLRVRAKLTRDAKVRIVLDRRKGKRFAKVRAVTRKGHKGSNVFKLARPAKKGRYRVRVVAIEDDQKTAPAIRKFRVKRT